MGQEVIGADGREFDREEGVGDKRREEDRHR
jgi:hypothetical protein